MIVNKKLICILEIENFLSSLTDMFRFIHFDALSNNMYRLHIRYENVHEKRCVVPPITGDINFFFSMFLHFFKLGEGFERTYIDPEDIYKRIYSPEQFQNRFFIHIETHPFNFQETFERYNVHIRSWFRGYAITLLESIDE